MNISYNFISLVAIGNFNPAIATLDFLTRVCELDLGELTKQSPKEMPMFKAFNFQNLEIIIDLNRLAIKETEIKDISDTRGLGIFETYYGKLPYTPLVAVGVNINCNLIPEMDIKTNLFAEKIKDPRSFLDYFGVNEIDVSEKSSCTKDDMIWKDLRYHIENVNNLTRLINVRKAKDLFSVNYNYEAGNLLQNPSKLELLFRGYNQFCDEFLRFLEYMEE